MKRERLRNYSADFTSKNENKDTIMLNHHSELDKNNLISRSTKYKERPGCHKIMVQPILHPGRSYGTIHSGTPCASPLCVVSRYGREKPHR